MAEKRSFLKKELTFKYVSSFDNKLEVAEPFDYAFASSGDYVVDDSHFVPMSEAVHQLGANMSASPDNLLYDFPDGKDTGIAIPLVRRKGVTLAEISTELENTKSSIRDVIEKDVIREREMTEYKQGLESIGSGE